MFSFGNKSHIIDKARRVVAKGSPEKAIEILREGLTKDGTDLPLILEIMHTYTTMDKFNEVIVWAKKGESLSEEASKQVLSETEDLYYGRGKPDPLAEYLIEKKADERDFEGISDIWREMSNEGKQTFREREKRIAENILEHKKEYSNRDITHLYTLGVILEEKESQRSVEIFHKIIERKPKELQMVAMELRRANLEYFGDEWLLLGLGHTLMENRSYEEGVLKIRNAFERNSELLPSVLQTLEPFKDKSREVLEYLSELYIESGEEEKALQLIKVFEIEEAIKKYQRMVSKDPANPLLHYNLGDAYLKKKRYSEALKAFLIYVEISKDKEIGKKLKVIEKELPEEIDPYLYMSSIYKELEQNEEAVRILERAFEISPTSADEILEKLDLILKDEKVTMNSLSLKANLLSRVNRVDESLETFKDLAQMPEGLEMAKRGLKELQEKDSVHTDVQLIYLMLQVPDNPGEVAQEVDRILSEEPDYVPFVLTEYDRWARKNPQHSSVFHSFYELLDRNKFPLFTYPFELAELNRIDGDFNRAENFYIEALSEQPDRFDFILDHLQKYRDKPEIRRITASLYFYKGEYKKGCSEIKMTLKQFPEEVSNLTTFLISQIQSGKENKYLFQTLTEMLLNYNYYEEAIKWGKKALASLSDEEQGELLISLSMANVKIHNFSEASRLARKACSIDNSLIEQAISIFKNIPDEEISDPNILMTLYELSRESGDTKKCSFYLNKALEQKPSMAEIIVGEYEKLIEMAPIEAILRIHYGRAKLLMGDKSGVSEIEKGVRFDPKLSKEAFKILEGYEDPQIASRALLVKGWILSELEKKQEAIDSFIEAYWKNKKDRVEALKGIDSLSPSVELSSDLVDKLFNVYHHENRNTRLVNMVERYFDGSTEHCEFLIEKINKGFEENPPLPLRISCAMMHYKTGEKEKASAEMEYLLKEYPEVASGLKDIVNPDDFEILPVLIRINLELSRLKKAIHYIKKLDRSKQLSYYEELLGKDPNYKDAVKELGYLCFLHGKRKKAKQYLESYSKPSRKEEILLWWLGKDIDISPKELKDMRKDILHDMIEVSESPDRRARLYIELKEFEKAYKEIENIEGEERDILISMIDLKVGNYNIAYQRLKRLKPSPEVNHLRYQATLHSRNFGLSLALLRELKMEPEMKKQYMQRILLDSNSKYNMIKPILRRE